jgi:peptide/nickel transport system substrate-binding protein
VIASGTTRGAAAQSGDGLTVTWGEDDVAPRTYDPRVTSSRHEYQVIAQIFDTLIASDGSNKLFPGLATAWDIAPDGKSVTLKLRTDVGFHDGTPFDAEAVKFTFDTIADPKTASEGAVTQLGPYAGTEVIDPHTVRVTYSQPFGAAVASYAEGTLAPVSPTAVKRLGNQGFSRAPVGAGPFRFVSWEEGRQVVLERFDKYNWAPSYNANQGPSSVQRVVTRFIGDASTRVAALEAGEIDISDATPVLDMKRLSTTAGYHEMIGNAAGIPFGLELNGSRGIFADVRVRRALAMAIDRDALVELVLEGLGQPARDSVISPQYRYYAETPAEPYHPAAAKQLLAEAGYPSGLKIPLICSNRPAIRSTVGVAIREMTQTAGFDIDVQTIPHDTYLANVWMKGNFYIGYWGMQATEDAAFTLLFTSQAAFADTAWNNAEFDALVAAGAATLDDAKRREIYAKAQHLMAQDKPSLIPFFQDVLTANRDRVKGWTVSPLQKTYFIERVWLGA